ncbi:MAG: DNA helicase UvrBC, partial [Thermoguttaceae bacterium]
MPQHHDIDFIFREWPYQSGVISARLIRAKDGREVLQMRIEMGLLQMETAGRPDGQRPGGSDSYLDYVRGLEREKPGAFVLSEEQCLEIDSEFLQFYQRRICCLALRKFDRAVADADHTLALMDFVLAHSPDQQWTLSHERYRPFVYFHRTQAATLARLEAAGPEAAIEEINAGLDRLRQIFAHLKAEDPFEENELATQLNELRESL